MYNYSSGPWITELARRGNHEINTNALRAQFPGNPLIDVIRSTPTLILAAVSTRDELLVHIYIQSYIDFMLCSQNCLIPLLYWTLNAILRILVCSVAVRPWNHS